MLDVLMFDFYFIFGFFNQIHVDVHGRTKLHYASMHGNLNDIISLANYCKKLDEKTRKEFLNKKDKDGKTALRHASKHGYGKIIDELVKAGAKVDLADEDGCTALHYASMFGFLNAVISLIKDCEKLDKKTIKDFLNKKDIQGKTALTHAYYRGYGEIVAKLVEVYTTLDLLDKNGRMVLHNASIFGDLNAIIYFISYCEKLDEKTRNDFLNQMDKDGMTALMCACKYGYVEIIDELVKAGAKVDLVDKDGFTALHYASRCGNLNAVISLIKCCEKLDEKTKNDLLNQKDNKGMTALMYASIDNYFEIIDELVKAGAKVDLAKDNDCTDIYYPSKVGRYGNL